MVFNKTIGRHAISLIKVTVVFYSFMYFEIIYENNALLVFLVVTSRSVHTEKCNL